MVYVIFVNLLNIGREIVRNGGRNVAASVVSMRGSDSEESAVSLNRGVKEAQAQENELLTCNTSVSLTEKGPSRQIVLSPQVQRKMYPGKYMDKRLLCVSVLRDTGYTFIVVKRSLLPPRSLTENEVTYVLMDWTTRSAPIAKVQVTTPLYNGELRALAVENPIADMIIGNIDVASEGGKEEKEAIGAVQTRKAAMKQRENIDECEEATD
ncbi:hypothetical protein ElyMa_005115700 [Elysia marginata]|uniref:Uncharacterized protein n=1 Tax=Elysia marginata TaxID=1093978 RepID=A0AAV4JJZ4_9GAST|nr:hypothetical protein ElyMa_005115700 [Elysia marginata]